MTAHCGSVGTPATTIVGSLAVGEGGVDLVHQTDRVCKGSANGREYRQCDRGARCPRDYHAVAITSGNRSDRRPMFHETAGPTTTRSGNKREREACQVIVDLHRSAEGRATDVGDHDRIDSVLTDREVSGVTHGDDESGPTVCAHTVEG